jgi:hypothetical protein
MTVSAELLHRRTMMVSVESEASRFNRTLGLTSPGLQGQLRVRWLR